MTSLSGTSVITPSRFEPLLPASEAAPDAIAARPGSVARRFLERFALIAFALYHVPLFLNNYPSLGGGGFTETGLAVRWGHIFTVPGLWVARHVFHLAGPMPSGSRGDNGDVSEEFARLLLAVVIGLVAAAWWTSADRRRPRATWVPETLRVLLRYSIALGLASYAIAKLLPVQFGLLSGTVLEQRVGDLSPMALLWTFMEYSRPYAFFGGLMEMAAVVLLCFRRTAMLGALTCLAVMVNVALLNWAYGVPVKLYSTMLVVSAAVLLAYDLPRLFAFFVKDAPVRAASTTSFLYERIPALGRWTIKLLLVGSVCLSSVVAMEPVVVSLNDTTGLSGTWAVDGPTSASEKSGTPAASAAWRQLVVDPFSVLIRTASNSAIACARGPASAADSQTLALTCAGRRQGALHWTRSADTLQVTGAFAGTPVTVTAHRVTSTYRLQRARFHLITE